MQSVNVILSNIIYLTFRQLLQLMTRTTMSWICEDVPSNLTDDYYRDQQSVNSSEDVSMDFHDFNYSSHVMEFPSGEASYRFIMMQIVIPVICGFGLLGNTLALAVLISRIRENIEMLERGSLIGMTGNEHSILM